MCIIMHIETRYNVFTFWRSTVPVPRFTGKTRITGKTAEIPEIPKNNREILIGASAITFIY